MSAVFLGGSTVNTLYPHDDIGSCIGRHLLLPASRGAQACPHPPSLHVQEYNGSLPEIQHLSVVLQSRYHSQHGPNSRTYIWSWRHAAHVSCKLQTVQHQRMPQQNLPKQRDQSRHRHPQAAVSAPEYPCPGVVVSSSNTTDHPEVATPPGGPWSSRRPPPPDLNQSLSQQCPCHSPTLYPEVNVHHISNGMEYMA